MPAPVQRFLELRVSERERRIALCSSEAGDRSTIRRLARPLRACALTQQYDHLPSSPRASAAPPKQEVVERLRTALADAEARHVQLTSRLQLMVKEKSALEVSFAEARAALSEKEAAGARLSADLLSATDKLEELKREVSALRSRDAPRRQSAAFAATDFIIPDEGGTLMTPVSGVHQHVSFATPPDAAVTRTVTNPPWPGGTTPPEPAVTRVATSPWAGDGEEAVLTVAALRGIDGLATEKLSRPTASNRRPADSAGSSPDADLATQNSSLREKLQHAESLLSMQAQELRRTEEARSEAVRQRDLAVEQLAVVQELASQAGVESAQGSTPGTVVRRGSPEVVSVVAAPEQQCHEPPGGRRRGWTNVRGILQASVGWEPKHPEEDYHDHDQYDPDVEPHDEEEEQPEAAPYCGRSAAAPAVPRCRSYPWLRAVLQSVAVRP
eukprot:TRINITY_DN13239_c0_g1_i3.p1 TRINITY_DN13239_c0_g1~~TRINITY_DN13239_c0_g1_i3.p1  ORF type:complete len:441 (+),score=121.59 TRINITY_DN13239_c0_g1_i3:58-1380(+)